MALVKKGSIDFPKIQPGGSIVVNNDGTIESSLTYKAESLDDLLEIGDLHPYDTRMECYQKAITYNSLGYITCQASFFGIEGATTARQLTYTGGTNSDPIEVHPAFESIIAGTASAPKNDAIFDEDTEEFIGFSKGELQGVQYYLTPTSTITLTYWTQSAPDIKLLQIQSRPPGTEGLILPNVENWLLVAAPVRNVGSYYQISEQWLGSADRANDVKGWSPEIYYQ